LALGLCGHATKRDARARVERRIAGLARRARAERAVWRLKHLGSGIRERSLAPRLSHRERAHQLERQPRPTAVQLHLRTVLQLHLQLQHSTRGLAHCKHGLELG